MQGRYIRVTFTNRLYTRHVQVNKKVSEPSRSYHTGEFPDWLLTCVNLFDDPVKWYCNLLFISYPFRTQYTWVDQKVLKLVAYLLKYTTELYQTHTEYATTISWFVSVVRMTQYAQRYVTSSFDDVMQPWPGVKNVRNCLFPVKCNHQHLCFMWQLFFRDYNGLDVAL